MKKILILILAIVMLLLISSCENSDKYPYDYVGFYDNQTRQTINIGDSRKQVERILGKGHEYDSTLTIYDNFWVWFDEKNKVYRLTVENFSDYKSTTEEPNFNRYELPGNINLSSIVADFIDLYDNVYKFPGEPLEIGIFVTESNKGYKILNKDKLTKKFNEDSNTSDVYSIIIRYDSYSEISGLEVNLVNQFNFEKVCSYCTPIQ